MAQNNLPEQESRIRDHESGEQTAREKPDFEVQEAGSRKQEAEESEKPTIPDTQKPQIPPEENIPAGGPGDQTTQTKTAQTHADKTDADKIEEIKKELKKPIHTNTPQERKDSNEIEDKHNKDVLSQN